MGLFELLANLGRARVRGQEGARALGIEPDAGGERQQRPGVRDVATVRELRLEERIDHAGLQRGAAFLLCEPGQPVRCEGVRNQGRVRVEGDALPRGDLDHAIEHRLVAATEPGAQVFGLGARLARIRRKIGVELERPVGDLDLVALREGRKGLLEALLADVAPGASDVGVDFNFHVHLDAG
ncbi:hypothetical protein D3C86_1305130 [compost metagenome]